MKINILITVLFLFFVGIQTSVAQNSNVLTEEDKKDLKLLGEEYLREFTDQLGKLPKMNPVSRDRMIKTIEKKFLPGAKIEIANSKNNIVSHPISTYLKKVLVNYGRYKIINITVTSFDVKKLKPMPSKPGFYYADFVFSQNFCRSNKGENIEGIIDYSYCDITDKAGRFVIKKVSTSQGSRWKLFFSDIKVVDYQKTK